ncbi:hypothetical protein TNCT_118371 [Trichonephila clavata]|uniref:Uncharacterized protein n=1 Tax=Trichonephila clavata TaxID=2740835 RepID=A0A8X6GWP8_TRICU|nr:hypothetical protein TNCT_118371 [Trichonephila clavata]
MIENDLFSNDPRLSDSCPRFFFTSWCFPSTLLFWSEFYPPSSLYPPVAFFSSSKVCLTSTFPLEWLFWSEFCPLLSPFDTQCHRAGNRPSHVDIPLRMALLACILSLLSRFDTQCNSAANRPSHVDIPLRMALFACILSLLSRFDTQ